MTYLEMVQTAPNKSEEMMWQAIADISHFFNEHMDVSRKFLYDQWAKIRGPHFDQHLANDVVDSMFHYDREGKCHHGEAIPIDEAATIIDSEHRELLKYDAYVAANAFAHDLHSSVTSHKDILELTKEFWFNDDDFSGESKIFWYIANK